MDAERRLWTPEGSGALEYLRGRGFTNDTIRAARLGWTSCVMIPKKDGTGSWKALGITIPWRDGDRLALVKIRQPEGRKPKYAEAYRFRPRMYPAPEAVCPGKPLVIVEGEFDALLLGQVLGELAAVLTLGSASARRRDRPIWRCCPLPLGMWRLTRTKPATAPRRVGPRELAGLGRLANSRIGPRPVRAVSTCAAGGRTASIRPRPWESPDPAPEKVSPSGAVEPLAPSSSETKALAVSMPWPPRPADPVECHDTAVSDEIIAPAPLPGRSVSWPSKGPRDHRLGHCWLAWHFTEETTA